jgi:hypothetical protein
MCAIHWTGSPGHYATDIFAAFPEEHVLHARHAGVLDVPANYLSIKVDRLIDVVRYQFVPDKSVCHVFDPPS